MVENGHYGRIRYLSQFYTQTYCYKICKKYHIMYAMCFHCNRYNINIINLPFLREINRIKKYDVHKIQMVRMRLKYKMHNMSTYNVIL